MVLKIIFAILIFILFFPLRINFLFYINLLKNRGALAVQIWGFSIMQDKFKISDGQVTTRNRRNKEKKIDLSKEDKSVIFLNAFVQAVIKKIILNDTYVGVDIGKKDDAMATAVLSGLSLVIIDMLFAQVFTRKAGSTHAVDSEPLFTTNKLSLCMQSTMYITVFDILFSAFRAYWILKRQLKKIKQETKPAESVA